MRGGGERRREEWRKRRRRRRKGGGGHESTKTWTEEEETYFHGNCNRFFFFSLPLFFTPAVYVTTENTHWALLKLVRWRTDNTHAPPFKCFEGDSAESNALKPYPAVV